MLFAALDTLDTGLAGQAQLKLYGEVAGFLRSASAWLARHRPGPAGSTAAFLKAARAAIEPELETVLPSAVIAGRDAGVQALTGAGVPVALARHLAGLPVALAIPEIALVAERAQTSLPRAARAYFAVTEALRIGRLEAALRGIAPADHFDGLALSRAGDMIGAARRALAVSALGAGGDDPVAAWLARGGERVEAVRSRLQALTETGEVTVSRLTVAAGFLGDLASG